MANTLHLSREMRSTPVVPKFTKISPNGSIEEIHEPRSSLKGYSPAIERKITLAGAHFESLGAEVIFRHNLAVLKAGAEGKVFDARADEGDQLSMRVVEQILYHSLVSDSYLPSNIPLCRGFTETFHIQRKLNDLDSTPGDRMEAYVRLINDPSNDLSSLLVALYTRIADMMTIHDPATIEAASRTRMPGVFPMHQSWAEVQKAMADPMMSIYCPIADWGGQTYAYRQMRDNAMLYMHPQRFSEVRAQALLRRGALANTNHLLMEVLGEMSASLGVNLVIANDYRTISQVFPEVDEDTVAVAIRPFKGVGGLLHKSLLKGIPIEMIKDWTGLTGIASTVQRMYDMVEFLHRAASAPQWRGWGSAMSMCASQWITR
jgi:hypothetical protein